jgi:hypothetical protein
MRASSDTHSCAATPIVEGKELAHTLLSRIFCTAIQAAGKPRLQNSTKNMYSLFLTFLTEEPMSSGEDVSCPWKMGKRGGVKGDRLGDFGVERQRVWLGLA